MTPLVAMGLRSALAGAPLPAVPAPEATVAVLDNGVRVVVVEDRRAPLVATWVRVAGGAGDAASPPSGVAHLLEHLLFAGSPLAPDGGYDRILGDLGAENNAWTDHDATALHALAPSGSAPLLLALEADRLGGLPDALDPAHVAVQLAVVEAEAALEDRAPHGRDLEAVLQAVFGPAHRYGAPVLGTAAGRATLDLDAALAFHAQRYGGRHLAVAVVGDVSAPAVVAEARAWLGELPAGPPQRRVVAGVPQPAAPVRLRVAPADRPTVTRAWPTVPAHHPDAPALALLAELEAGGPDRPLDTALADRPDVVRAWPWGGDHAGLFALEVGGAAPLADLARALDAATKPALDAAAADGPALERARRAALVRHLQRAEDPLVRAEAAAECVARTGGVGCAARALERLRAVSVADLQRVRDTWLTADRAVTVALLPEGAAPETLEGAVPLVLP